MAKVRPVPEGLHTLTIQVSVDKCAEAIEFYKKVFNAEEKHRAPDPSGKKIWHAELRIGDSALFVNDTFPEMGGGTRNADLWLYAENAEQLFERAVGAGATVVMPMVDMFWGDRSGTVVDPFGNRWTLARHVKDMTFEEMQKAGEAFAAAQKK